MNLRDLKYLIAVADTGHFGRAAEACYVSQPTLSTQIKKLEEYLGVQLIERTSKQAMLTPIGEQVVAKARAITNASEDIVRLCDAAGDPLAGDFRLGLIPTIAPYLLPHLVPALKQAMPKLSPFLYEDQTARVVERLRRGELDAGIMAVPVDATDLAHAPLFREPFMLATPAEHPLAQQAPVPLSVLEKERILLLDEGHCLRDQALDLCNMVGAQIDNEFRATSMETLRQMVASGGGVTLLPALAAAMNTGIPNAEAITLSRFKDPQPERLMALYWRKGSARGELNRQLAALIRGLPAIRQYAMPVDEAA